MREDKLSIQSMDFAIDIINLVKELKLKKESIISNQIGRSGTSFDCLQSTSFRPWWTQNDVVLCANISCNLNGVVSRRSTIRTRLKVLKKGFFFVVAFAIPRITESFRLEKSLFSRFWGSQNFRNNKFYDRMRKKRRKY